MSYKPVKPVDEEDGEQQQQRNSWNEYPGQMRHVIASEEGSIPKGFVFIKTGGNALQAIDSSLLEHETTVRVVVPEGKGPGDILLVRCPITKTRFIPTTIPENAKEGTEFLVRIPPPLLYNNNNETDQFSDSAIVGINLAGKLGVKNSFAARAMSGFLL
eukprot:scaffold22672_cov141-Cylindrotheca_fusiformis.AAC.11